MYKRYWKRKTKTFLCVAAVIIIATIKSRNAVFMQINQVLSNVHKFPEIIILSHLINELKVNDIEIEERFFHLHLHQNQPVVIMKIFSILTIYYRIIIIYDYFLHYNIHINHIRRDKIKLTERFKREICWRNRDGDFHRH